MLLSSPVEVRYYGSCRQWTVREKWEGDVPIFYGFVDCDFVHFDKYFLSDTLHSTESLLLNRCTIESISDVPRGEGRKGTDQDSTRGLTRYISSNRSN